MLIKQGRTHNDAIWNSLVYISWKYRGGNINQIWRCQRISVCIYLGCNTQIDSLMAWFTREKSRFTYCSIQLFRAKQTTLCWCLVRYYCVWSLVYIDMGNSMICFLVVTQSYSGGMPTSVTVIKECRTCQLSQGIDKTSSPQMKRTAAKPTIFFNESGEQVFSWSYQKTCFILYQTCSRLDCQIIT